LKFFLLTVTFLSISIPLYCYNRLEVKIETFINKKDIAILEKIGIERNKIPNKVTVIETDNLTEFLNLSHAPFYVAAVTVDGIIYIQNRKYLLDRFEMTLKHEVFHVVVHKLGFPYWFEEGIVCELTGEWKGKSRRVISEVENIDPWSLKNRWELETYSYSCWRKVKEIMDF